MGKATIVSGGTDGKYMVKMDYGKAAQTANLERITKRQTELVGLQAAALQDLNLEMIIESLSLEAVENAIRDYVDAAADASATQQALADAEFANSTIASSVTATPAEKAAAAAAVVAAKTAAQNAAESFKKVPGAHAAALAKLVAAKAKTAKLQLVWQILKDEQTQLQKDHDYWAGLKLEETKEVWCADFIEDAKGIVEIMEIPGEDLKVLIGPQDEGHKLTNVGALTAREVQSPAQVFFNAAILPGWQKFKPMYRRGVVTKVDNDGDTVDVTFDDDKSSAQKLDINRYKKLAGIPVKYMACNAGVFEKGDHCVVKFTDQNWSLPVVVGFVDNPKPCGGGLYFAWNSHKKMPANAVKRQWWQKYAKADKPGIYSDFKDFDRAMGYCTWSSGFIKSKSSQIQLSWGSAGGDRYQIPTGTLLWVDGIAIQLSGASPEQNIFAACIVREPGGYFIRVCRGMGLGSEGAQVDIVDYGNTSVGMFLDARQLKAATSAQEMRRYAMSPLPVGVDAMYQGSDTNRWTMLSRPCFNESGNSLACIILAVDPGGPYDEYDNKHIGEAIAVISVPDMLMEQKYIGGQHYSSTQTVSNSGHPEFPIIYESSATTGSSSTTAIIAVDYLGDELVWVWKRVERTSNASGTVGWGIRIEVVDEASGSRIVWLTCNTAGSHSNNYHITAGHSRHGTVVDFSFSVAAAWTTQDPESLGDTTGTMTRSGAMRYMDVGFMGDLSRDCFAFGWAKDDFTAAPTFPTQEFVLMSDSYIRFTGPGVAINPVCLQYTAYINGVSAGEVFRGNPIFNGPTNDGRTPPASWLEQMPDDSWRVKDGAISGIAGTVGSGADPAYNYTETYSRTRQVSLSSYTQWGVESLGSFRSPDFTSYMMRGLGFYTFTSPTAWQAAASASRKAAYFTDMQTPSTESGICHLLRAPSDAGEDIIKMDFSGETNQAVPVEYLLTPFEPIFIDAQVKLS